MAETKFCLLRKPQWPPMFGELNYQFWKVRIKIFIKSIHRGIWDVIANGSYIPKTIVDGEIVEKPFSEWTRAQYDCIRKILSPKI